jgi:hypothetical protein
MWVSWTCAGTVATVLAITLTFYVVFSRVYKHKLAYIRDQRHAAAYAAKHPEQFITKPQDPTVPPSSQTLAAEDKYAMV